MSASYLLRSVGLAVHGRAPAFSLPAAKRVDRKRTGAADSADAQLRGMEEANLRARRRAARRAAP